MIYALLLALALIAWLAWKKPRTYSGRGDLLRYELKQTAASETEGWR